MKPSLLFSRRAVPLAALGLALALGLTSPARAQTSLIITAAPRPEFRFAESAVFQVSAISTAVINSATLYYRAAGDDRASAASVAVGAGTNITAEYKLDLTTHGLPPFAPVQYWWEVRDTAGGRAATEPQTFVYEDNRFAWQALEQDGVTVHWYEGDSVFGQIAVDTAGAALGQASRMLGTPAPRGVNIYVYASAADVRETLAASGRAWAGGHADPALGVVVVAVAPDLAAGINLGRAIPHEVMHLIVYAAAGSNYARVPAWLNEGLAVFNQHSPDPGLADALEAARQSQKLLSLSELCAPFPADPAQAQTAYAESESVVRYLRDRFGEAALPQLLSAYAGGADCATGVQQALGLPLAELERRWLAEAVKINPAPFQDRTLAPWLLLAAFVLGGPLLAALLGRATGPEPHATIPAGHSG